MQMSSLYAPDFAVKNSCKPPQQVERMRKKVLVVDKSTDHDKPHFDLFFLHNINVKENTFLRARADLTRAAWYRLIHTHTYIHTYFI